MSYAICRRCGAQLGEPKLGSKIECPSCHAVYSAKTTWQAAYGAPHCSRCGAELTDEALADKTWGLAPDGRLGPLGNWFCTTCRGISY
jgi:DNA-directed RNA polymerase subunit RPC12/RpoP